MSTKKVKAYVSFSMKSGSMLALWVDHCPSGNKDQTDPDGWVSGVSGTQYEIERLCELSKVPGANVIRINDDAAEWWEKIEKTRKLATKKAERDRLANAQSLFPIPEEIEREGRDEGLERTRHKREAKLKRTA